MRRREWREKQLSSGHFFPASNMCNIFGQSDFFTILKHLCLPSINGSLLVAFVYTLICSGTHEEKFSRQISSYLISSLSLPPDLFRPCNLHSPAFRVDWCLVLPKIFPSYGAGLSIASPPDGPSSSMSSYFLHEYFKMWNTNTLQQRWSTTRWTG